MVYEPKHAKAGARDGLHKADPLPNASSKARVSPRV